MTKTPTILGHTPCPICDNASAEVRTDRNDLAYIYCAAGCYTQVFTRDKHRDGLLRARMRPAVAAAPAAFVPAEAAPLGLPLPAPAAVPVPPAPPAPPAAKRHSTWLTTLLDK